MWRSPWTRRGVPELGRGAVFVYLDHHPLDAAGEPGHRRPP